MTLELLFSLAGGLAMLGWLMLLAAPLAQSWLLKVGGFYIPLALSALYIGLIAAYWGSAQGGYDTLANVMRLFDSPGAALAGSVHYLAFDLFIGGWIAQDAGRRQIAHWMLVPCFVLTFLFGPIGLLVYAGLRLTLSSSKRRSV